MAILNKKEIKGVNFFYKLKTKIKWLVFISVLLIAMITVGTVGALNGWFGGGGDIPFDTMSRGLVGYWSFDEGSGTDFYDANNANNGTLYNDVSWSDGKNGSAISFDGVDDVGRVENSANLNPTAALSYEYWINPNAGYGPGDYATPFHKGGNNQWYSRINVAAGTITSVMIISWPDYTEITSPSPLPVGEWTHVTATYNGSVHKLYIDGAEVNSIPMSGSLGTTASPLDLGSSAGTSWQYNGLLDEVRIYNRALSAAEVRYHYNRGAPVAHWKFDEGSGTTAYDSAGNNDGILTNGPLWVEGKYSTAIDFDGTNDYIYLGQPSDLNTNVEDVTISAWVKLDRALGMYSTNYEIFSNESYQNYGYLFRVEDSSNPTVAGKIHFRTNQTAASTGITASSMSYPNDQDWHYLTVTKNGTVGKIYLDSLEVSSYSSYSSLSDPVDSLSAAYIGGPSQRFYGLIDDVRIYKYARTEEEIRLDYNAGFAVRFGPMSSCERDPGSCMTKGSVGYWDFEEGEGSLTLDKSGQGNNGILQNNPSWGSGIIPLSGGKTGSSALGFDGENDYVEIPAHSNPTQQITIELWAKSGEENWNDHGYLASKRNAYILHPTLGTKSVSFYIYTTDWDYVAFAPDDITEWHQYLGVYDGTYIKFYIDGELKASKAHSLSGSINADAGVLQIGHDEGFGDRYGNCMIDDVRIYNRALSAEEVRYHYNQGEPVAHWKFDEGSGTTAYDFTNNNNSGTLINGPIWTTGKYGSALSFDGSNDYVSVADSNSLDTENAVTVSAWIKTGDYYSGTQGYILRKGEEGAGNVDYGFSIQGSPGYLKFDFNNGGWQAGTLDTSQSVTDNDWHFVSVTYDRNHYIYYVDGIRGDSIVQTTAMAKTTKDLYIGNDLTAYYFNGLIDDVRVYNYARTEEQIKQDYNAGLVAHFGPLSDCDRDPGSCMTEGLVGYWDFEDGNGDLTEDKSGNGNDGTLYNNPSWDTGTIPLSGGKTGGGALGFDGSDDYVEALVLTPDYVTVEAWINMNGISAIDYPRVVSNLKYEVDAWKGFEIYQLINSKEIRVQINVGGSWYCILLGTPNLGEWAHVAFTSDGSNLYTYFNGVAAAPTAVAGAITYHSSPDKTYIGKNPNIGADFNGRIDEVRIYDRALSETEIRYHYNQGGPIAHWKFDEGEGTTAYDYTNNNNDGTLTNGPTWAEGRYGSAVNFDSTDDYIDAGENDSLNITNAITIEAWVKINDLSGHKTIANKTDVHNWWEGYFLSVYDSNGKIEWVVGGENGDTGFGYLSNNGISPGSWYHIVAFLDITNNYSGIYINGVLDKEETAGTLSQIGVASNNFLIGKRCTGGYFYDGQIDDVRMYNYARTEEQIRQDYNAGLNMYFR
jgi:hypothetical protein